MSMDKEVSWPVRSQPSLQCTTTEVFPDSTLSAIRNAPARINYKNNDLVEKLKIGGCFFSFYVVINAHLDVLEPMSGLQIGEPVGVLNVGVDHVLQLAKRLPHHVDVVNIQEHQLCVLIGILTFITTSFHLKKKKKKKDSVRKMVQEPELFLSKS